MNLLKNKSFCLTALFFFLSIQLQAQTIVIDKNNLPLIQQPDAKDLIFRQFTEDADYNTKIFPDYKSYNKDGSEKKLLYSFYRLKVPQKMDFIWLSSRLSPVYKESIATLNRLSSSDSEIGGKEILICSFSGIFIPEKPESPWEQLLYKQYISKLKDSSSVSFKIDGRSFLFFERHRFDSTTGLFFMDTNMISPLKSSILTSEFGYRISPISGKWKFHSGIDLAAPEGSEIFACKAGEISQAGFNSTYGNFIIILHYNGTTSVYAHLSKILVKKGQKVIGGTLIGKVGSTGASTGPHLHFELRKNGSPTDPEKFIGR